MHLGKGNRPMLTLKLIIHGLIGTVGLIMPWEGLGSVFELHIFL